MISNNHTWIRPSFRESQSVWTQWEKPSPKLTASRGPPSSSTHLPSASLRLASPSAQTPPRLPPLATCLTSTPHQSLLLRYRHFLCRWRFNLNIFKWPFTVYTLTSVFPGPQWEGWTLPASPVCSERSQCWDTGVQLCIDSLLRFLCFAGTFFIWCCFLFKSPGLCTHYLY